MWMSVFLRFMLLPLKTVDRRDLSDIPPNGSNVIDVQQLLPSDGDINFITLGSRYDFSCVSCFIGFFNFRVLVSHGERFMSNAPTLMWHIPTLIQRNQLPLVQIVKMLLFTTEIL